MLQSKINEITNAIVVSSNIPVAVSKLIVDYVASSVEQDREDMRKLHYNFREIYEYLRRWSNENNEPVNNSLMELEQYEYERWVFLGHVDYKIVKDLISYYTCTQPLRDRLVILFKEADDEMDFHTSVYNHRDPVPSFKNIAAPEMN
jgi:hypothetical protein